MSIGILIAVSQASNMITTPIINFASLRNRMNAAEPIIQSFYDKEKNVAAERIKTNRIETIKIDLDELKEDGKVLLQDIHLQFDRGKKYMIMGPSGCGKTTLLTIFCVRITKH
ncbi:ATP-binding cassette domain-containing protein [uncultured Dubosiella sp.]|uniref:ATP-binding cassette domain-containing protein n=2 Tax=uncultured Dubosiella sp. TaxID=1937011 RepID=UPI0026039D9E|nr:ATP-binding cassette domain-containing protein [uncultured Dubosiella sp.]